MGFLTNTLGKSLFTEDSYKRAVGDFQGDSIQPGYGVIVINPTIPRLGNTVKDAYLIGLMKENLHFNVEAHWEAMGGFSNVLPSLPGLDNIKQFAQEAFGVVNNFGNMAGGADLGAVYSSKKIYHKSGYLNINPSFRIVDWEGNYLPLKSAYLAASYCVPANVLGSLGDFTDQMIEKLKNNKNGAFQDLGNTLAGLKTVLTETGPKFIAGNIINIGNKISPNIGDGIGRTIGQASQDLIEDYFQLKSSPSPVEVIIGEYFYHNDMVIEGVDINFSKEMTKFGPLYVDITMNISSRKIIATSDNLGFKPNFNNQNVRLLTI